MPDQFELLVVDPQHDFCDPLGALYVRGADEDMTRLAKMVRRMGQKLRDINVTLDCHHEMNIAHPVFWTDKKGRHPQPFTLITLSEVIDGSWAPVIRAESIRSRATQYATELNRIGRYPQIIWPPHCIVGGLGPTIVPDLHQALGDWARREQAIPNVISKGTNIFTDFRSAIQADVPDPLDPTTSRNELLVSKLLEAETVLVAGTPASHMLAETLRDVMQSAPDLTDMRKFVLLTDATSPIPGFEAAYEAFVCEMRQRKMRIATTRDF